MRGKSRVQPRGDGHTDRENWSDPVHAPCPQQSHSGVPAPASAPSQHRLGTVSARQRPLPYSGNVSQELDIDAMIRRFQERAKAVRNRPMPPVEVAERKLFVERAQTDFMDFAIIGDAVGNIEDGFLVLRVDLRPSAKE
jgi:hypothetical protein